MICGGTPYGLISPRCARLMAAVYGVFSKELKAQFSLTQTTVNLIGSFSHLGLYINMPPGLIPSTYSHNQRPIS